MEKKIIINGLYYGEIKGNKIAFTTDVPDFKLSGIEEAMEMLFEKFNITKFQVKIHSHPGIKHDKDIQFALKDKKRTEEIINFILREFYSLV